MRGAVATGQAPPTAVPQWALLAGFAVVVGAALPFVARGNWPRLLATTAALLLFFMLVNPWFFPWYQLAPLVLVTPLPRGRAHFVLRGLTAGIGAISLLMYAKLIPWP